MMRNSVTASGRIKKEEISPQEFFPSRDLERLCTWQTQSIWLCGHKLLHSKYKEHLLCGQRTKHYLLAQHYLLVISFLSAADV